MSRPIVDMRGKIFGKLTILKMLPHKKGPAKWLALCICGENHVIVGTSLRNRKRNAGIEGCGCGKPTRIRENPPGLKHGHSRVGKLSRTYKSWILMRSRCSDNRYWKSYGGRGIGVCKRWNRFENFLKDMGEKPAGLTLERKNNDKGYYLRNCKWATYSEQNRNKRRWAKSV